MPAIFRGATVAATAVAAASAVPASTAVAKPHHHHHHHHRKHHVRAHAASASHPVHRVAVPRWAVRLAAKHRHAAGRPARTGTSRHAARYTMPHRDVRRLLRVSWRAFGYHGQGLRVRVARNYRQVMRESAGRPAVLQGYIGDVNDHRPAGGLLQFTTPTMRHWHVANRSDRFNPLDNLLAAVNAQAHGPYYILNGRSGWSPPLSHNPLRGRRALGVIAPQAPIRVSEKLHSTPTAKAAVRRVSTPAVPAAATSVRRAVRPTARTSSSIQRDLLARPPRAPQPSLYLLADKAPVSGE